MDLILTNSKNTQARIQKFLWVDSTILYPPVDMELFHWIEQKDYYLSFARLADAKRVDKIVAAFKKLPEKKLVIIYGENDPQRQKIFDLAWDAKNIQFVTLPGNVWFTDYVGKSIATLYIPIDEDFGMSPVESMSAGKPVIGVNDGGLKETIIDGKTGILIPAEANVDDLIEAIQTLTPVKALSMKDDCIARASEFGLWEFKKQLQSFVK